MLVRDYLMRNREIWPERIAYISETARLGWGEVADRSSRLAAALQGLGIGKGDVVASMSYDSHEVVELWYACSLIGAIRAGINPRYAPAEVEHLLTDSNARVLLVEGGDCEQTFDRVKAGPADLTVIGFGRHQRTYDYEQVLASAIGDPVLPVLGVDDILALSYTTGTTGLPKGALWRQGGVIESLVKSWMQTGVQPDDVYLHCLPAAGVPVCWLTHNVVNGSRVVIQRKFSAAGALELIEAERVTSVGWVPTMMLDVLSELAATPRDISSLRLVVYGTAPATPALVRQASQALGCQMQQWYGSTEGTLGCYAILSWEDHREALNGKPEILSSSGRPTLHCEVRILDDDLQPVEPGQAGNICVRSATLMAGYHNRPEETAAVLRDGWLMTGDLGILDSDGYLRIVDRKNFMIITGSYNVYPIVVENVLADHRSVHELCVFGIPDERWGEAVCAVVVPAADVTDHDALRAELVTLARDRLAKFEVPKRIDFVDELPRGTTGKLLKRLVRDEYWEKKDIV
ncbi:class I adenylate-forming enzyme family protein [Streptomyces sp. NPDC056405]|uniref:class I adenylate-forming enzyme family protein n=1 Tax=Streptomyces sp. NPDC056405 TaxID=3345811 RepID=UPI0035DC0B04